MCDSSISPDLVVSIVFTIRRPSYSLDIDDDEFESVRFETSSRVIVRLASNTQACPCDVRRLANTIMHNCCMNVYRERRAEATALRKWAETHEDSVERILKRWVSRNRHGRVDHD